MKYTKKEVAEYISSYYGKDIIDNIIPDEGKWKISLLDKDKKSRSYLSIPEEVIDNYYSFKMLKFGVVQFL